MQTVTLYDSNNSVIIVNKTDVDKYKAIGFSTNKADTKKKVPENAKTEPKTEDTSAKEDDKRNSKK